MFSLANQAAKLTNVNPRAEPETVQQLFGEAA